jgi:adenylyltransferase/sulfurtransferase
VEVLCKRLKEGNSSICLEAYDVKVDGEFLVETIDDYDIIVDAVDNIETKLSINDYSSIVGKPYVFGGVVEYIGQVLSVIPGSGPCLRCLISEIPHDRNTSPPPVFAPVPGIVGCIQASEVIKLLIKIGNPLVGRFLTFDALDWSYSIIPFVQRKGCSVCGND